MGNGTTAARIWQGPPDDALRLAPLDAVTLIFDRRSAQTHIVTSPVPEILAMIGDAAVSESALLAQLIAAFELTDAPDMAQALSARLDEMAALGLVAQAHAPAAT